jgi:hypothetical protein
MYVEASLHQLIIWTKNYVLLQNFIISPQKTFIFLKQIMLGYHYMIGY